MADKKPRTAIQPTREEDYPEWYQQVIKAADLAEPSPARGCMVIKPWGYAIWENMQAALDRMFKETGHQNAYFPLFIPMSFLEKEAQHVEGFAKECAVVTHHRLEPGPDGGLVPVGKLEEPYVVRPTSETMIGAKFAEWVQSYRDLPILLNQWCNVVRWEMRTRMFLRTTEFLWQEGHTAHATQQEAMEETLRMLGVYARFAEGHVAMPVIQGEKTARERFPGAVATYTIEAMMQDRKALQAGTSHFLGQNFARAQEIKFQDQAGNEVYAWTTSWGMTTRMVGALIMTHSDDNGLVLPPRLAPLHVVLLPIYRNGQERSSVMPSCVSLKEALEGQCYEGRSVRVMIDDRDMRGGEKVWYHIKRGVPLRVEIGPRDISANTVSVARRDTQAKQDLPRAQFVQSAVELLSDIQHNLFQRAANLRKEHTREINNVDEFREFFTPQRSEKPEIHGGFALCHFVEDPAVDKLLASLKVSIRCVPLDEEADPGRCIFTGQPSPRRAVFAKGY
jgi:prolyl-tRNA synthetase